MQKLPPECTNLVWTDLVYLKTYSLQVVHG